MARQSIDIGTQGNDGTGDSIRESFRKVNDNFKEIYAIVGGGDTIGFVNLDDVDIDKRNSLGTPVTPTQPATSLEGYANHVVACLLYTSPSPRDRQKSRMPSSA